MQIPTRVGVALVAVAVLSLVVSAGAFSTTEADRPVNVDVVGDEEAYMGLVYEDIDAEGLGDPVTSPGSLTYEDVVLVTVRNQFDADINDVEADIDVDADDGVEVTLDQVPGAISAGQSDDVTVDVTCPATSVITNPSAAVDFNVGAQGHNDAFSAETTEPRSVLITCDTQSIDESEWAVTFTGSGNARIAKPSDVGSLDVTVWYLDGNQLHETSETSLTGLVGDEQTTLRKQDVSAVPNGADFAALYVGNVDGTFVHQNLVYQDGGWTISGGSGSGNPTFRICEGAVDISDTSSSHCWI